MKSAKIVLLGDSNVGKTSIANRIKFNIFNEKVSPTIGCEFFAHTINDIRLLIWDTAGQETFRSFVPQFCRNADLGLLFYDINKSSTIQNLESWIDCTPSTCIIILVPTKIDLKENDKDYVIPSLGIDRKIYTANPTSAKTGENISELVLYVCEILNSNNIFKYDSIIESSGKTVQLVGGHREKKCCSS